MTCVFAPSSIPIVSDRISYTPPEAGLIPNERKRRKKADGTNDKQEKPSPSAEVVRKNLESTVNCVMPKCKSIDHMWRNPNRVTYRSAGRPAEVPERKFYESESLDDLTVEECIRRGICPRCHEKLIFESGCMRCFCGWSAC